MLRPPGAGKVPVIVAWSPYGKSQGTVPSVTSLFATIGIDNAAVSGQSFHSKQWDGIRVPHVEPFNRLVEGDRHAPIFSGRSS